MARDRWYQDLPRSILAEEKSQDVAKLWGTEQRTIAAKAWADTLRQDAMDTYATFTKRQPPANDWDKLTTGQGAYTQPDQPQAASFSPEAPGPPPIAALRTPFGPSPAVFPKPPEIAKPTEDEEAETRVRQGRAPYEDIGQAVGGLASSIMRQGEALPGAIGDVVMPGGRRVIGELGDIATTAVKRAGVKAGESLGGPVSAGRRAVRKMYLEPDKRPPDVSTPGGLERLRRSVVRAATDERVDLNELVNESKDVLGRPLTSAERVDEIVRLNAPVAAQQRAREALKPAFSAVRAEMGDEGPVLLREFLTYQDNIDKELVKVGRVSSGGIAPGQSTALTDEVLATLSPAQKDALEASSQRVWDFGHDIVRRKQAAGIIDAETADNLIAEFPHYTPINILDYVPLETRGSGGKKISLDSQGIRRLTAEGSDKARRDPIAALIEAADRAEGDIVRNRAFNGLISLKDQVPEIGRFFKEVPADYTAKSGRGEQVLEGFVDGVKKRYAVPYDLHQAVTLANKSGEAPALSQALLGVWRELVTGRNPLFVAANAPLDAMTYLTRQASREGGPQAVPSAFWSLMKAYGETFNGLMSGEFRGAASEYLKEGGGVFGLQQRSPASVEKFTAGLDRPNPFSIRNAGDVGRIVKDVLRLEPVAVVAERVELAPRVASFQRAKEAGKRTQEAVMQGRDVTLDFQRAGTVARVLNSYIPFFNVGAQAGVNVARMIRENPKGATATLGSLVATPTLMTELWNRSDPDREAAYEDVPDYIKRRSLVVMLPFTPGQDDRGNPRPPFVEIRLREAMGIAAPLREVTAEVLGKEGDGAKELAMTMLASLTPVNVTGAEEVPFEIAGPILGTAGQLATDRDTFRQRPIATEAGDERASELAQLAARAIGGRPSQWEFAARNLLGAYAQMGLPASNLIAGRPRTETGAVQDIPIAGGLLRKMGGVLGGIGAETGQKLETARENRYLPADVTKALTEAGIRYEPTPLRSEYDDVPLKRAEQAEAQATTNTLFVSRMREAIKDPGWKELTSEEKEDWIKSIAADTRTEATESVLYRNPDEEIDRRYESERKRVESRR